MTRTETFYQLYVTRGNHTFAYSAEEYDSYPAAEEEAARLFGLGEPSVGIYRFTRTTTSEFMKRLFPEAA